jgi:hypothetical protein
LIQDAPDQADEIHQIIRELEHHEP